MVLRTASSGTNGDYRERMTSANASHTGSSAIHGNGLLGAVNECSFSWIGNFILKRWIARKFCQT